MAFQMMTSQQRIETCLAGCAPDRPPVALWRHFPIDDQSPEKFTAAALNFQRTYDFDLVKLTPSSSFCLRDWGALDEWRGNVEGTREYTRRVIQQPEDWLKLSVLNPCQGFIARQLDCIGQIIKELDSHTPLIQTVFSPLAQAKNLVGRDNLLIHLRQYPDLLKIGLQTIAKSTQLFVEQLRTSGIAGIFFAVQFAQYGLLSLDEYEIFEKPYDLMVLEAATDFWLNVLHIHGEHIMFDQMRDYPMDVINWHDRETGPSLAEGWKRVGKVVCGGLKRWETMVLGNPEHVTQEAMDAIVSMEGKNIILGTGCVLPVNAPHGNIEAARRSVELFR